MTANSHVTISIPDAYYEPIFIVGPGRSGSTLLRAMLNGHSQLDISKESYLITALRNVWCKNMTRQQIELFALRLRLFPRPPEVALVDYLGWDHEQLCSTLWQMRDKEWRDVVVAIFTRRTSELGKTYWGNKTPDYGLRLPAIIEIFPRSKILFLVRDGRDVTLSYLACDWGPDSFFNGAEYWRRQLEAYQNFCDLYPDAKIILVKYEDLTSDPEKTLHSICRFLDIPFEHDMLSYHENLSSHFSPDAQFAHHQLLKKPTRPNRNYRWKKEVSERDRAIFQGICAPLLEFAGYETENLKLSQLFWSLYAKLRYSLHRLKKSSQETMKWYCSKL